MFKNKGITYDEVRNFIQNQESSQLFKKKKRIAHYFPITANFKFEILQIDLVDMSDIATANKNYKYLLVAIDVFSRYAFVYPLRSKSAEYITEVMQELIEETAPTIINTDLGSEFISSEFKKIITRQGIEINYIGVHEHKKIGIIDRFVRTLRQKINMYLTQYNTSKYIDVLQTIVDNYNNNYHSGIKMIPADVTKNDPHIKNINVQKINKASKEEDIYITLVRKLDISRIEKLSLKVHFPVGQELYTLLFQVHRIVIPWIMEIHRNTTRFSQLQLFRS